MTKLQKKNEFNRDIFVTGEYVRHFNPDNKQNPFRIIYARKKRDVIDIIKSYINPQHILDVGGGMGRLSLALTQFPQYSVFLTDISIDMLKLASENADNSDNLKIINADVYKLPFADNSFDCVVGLDLLCHLEDPKRALGEFRRVLNPKGFLILDSTNSNPLWTIFYPRYLGKNPLNWIKIIKLRGVYPGWQSIVRHYSKKEFLSLLFEVGFEITQNLNYGPWICPKWHLVVSKKMG